MTEIDRDQSLDELLSAKDRVPGVRLVEGDGVNRLDGGDVHLRVSRLAGALRAAGIEPGDRVAWQLPNGTDAALLYRACWRIDAVAVPLHHRAPQREVDLAIATVRPKAVVDTRFLERHTPTRRGSIDVASPTFTGDAAILFTAGSSGTPKAVVHTRSALAYKAALMVGTHGLTPDDCVLMPAPLAHVSGLLNGLLVPGAIPCKAVLMERWDPLVALDLIDRERVTFMVGPPTFFVSLWQSTEFTPEKVESLRLVSCGGAGVTAAFCEEATRKLGARVKRTYGSTEAPTVATSRSGDAAEMGWRHDGRAIGRAELRVDPANGELLVRGPELFRGYLDIEQTREAFAGDGWFRTGDVAMIDDDGWLTITGRMKDVIIRGGENIATAEVESVLESHPSIDQAVAVGYPDQLMGERVCAFVVASVRFGLDDCRAWFAEQGVAKFKTPERIVRIEALPLLASGKPDRVMLRRRAAQEIATP